MRRPRGGFSQILTVVLAAALILATAAHAAVQRGPRPHTDPADAAASPLDLRAVTFGQRGTELVLRMTTGGPWSSDQLDGVTGRELCVHLFYGALPTARSRICAGPGLEGRTTLRYERLTTTGTPLPGSARPIGAYVDRPDDRSLEATMQIGVVNLGVGRYSWQARSRWSCAPDPACEDRFPAGGNVIARIRPLAEPRCFGAAARNPRHVCRNRALRLAVIPEPSEAVILPNAGCTVINHGTPYTCQFGVRPKVAKATAALIGDSHAVHWRAALEVVMQAKGWRGVSLSRSGCPLSMSAPAYGNPRRRSCMSWRGSVRRWLARRPTIRTVFISNHAAADIRARPGTRNIYAAKVRGFQRMFRRLPRSVRRVVVIRDTPRSNPRSGLCVLRALTGRKRPDLACALPRRAVLDRDPAVDAARRMRSRRFAVVDLTAHMCSRRLCFPVVGGALVHKDLTHMTQTFNATLGPYLLRRVNAIVR